MNKAQLTEFYAKKTGLSKADVKVYRDTPVSGWTTRADRKVGSTLRLLERLALDRELSWEDWRKQATVLLKVVHDWVHGMLDTVASFVERMAAAAERVLAALTKVLTAMAPYLPLLVILAGRRLAGGKAT